MVLAAGLGLRLRPITEHLPKPLVEVGGRTLLDHAIDRLARAGVERVVVNVHYRAAMIAAHLAGREHPRIAISEEPELLDTGGGVRQALPLLGEAFFVVNGDVLWRDGRTPALTRLARAFDPAEADAVLLLQRKTGAVGYDGIGDYFLDACGRPRRRREREAAPYLFAGIQLLHRRLFDGVAAARRRARRRMVSRRHAGGAGGNPRAAFLAPRRALAAAHAAPSLYDPGRPAVPCHPRRWSVAHDGRGPAAVGARRRAAADATRRSRAARSLSCRRARERRGRAAAAAAAAARDRRSRGRRDRADRRRRHGAAGAFRIAPAPAADPAGAEMGRTARP